MKKQRTSIWGAKTDAFAQKHKIPKHTADYAVWYIEKNPNATPAQALKQARIFNKKVKELGKLARELK